MGIHKVDVPKKIKFGNFELLQPELKHILEDNLNDIQEYFDKEVIKNLQAYVAFDKGTMAGSIKTSSSTRVGEGQVAIDTKYAAYQAYSPKVHKRDGLRGKYPFERMAADKGQTILNDVSEYSRRKFG